MKKHSARVAPLSACNSPVLTLTKVEGEERPRDPPGPAEAPAPAGAEAGGRAGRRCWRCSRARLRKTFWGVAVVLCVCSSWAGATQLAKLTFGKFDAPFTLTWFATNWNCLFFPLYYAGHVCKSAEKQSVKQRYSCLGLNIRQRGHQNQGTVSALWTVSSHWHDLPFKKKPETLISAIYHNVQQGSPGPLRSQMVHVGPGTSSVSILGSHGHPEPRLSVTVYRPAAAGPNQIYPEKNSVKNAGQGDQIVAAILAIAGIVMMTYADGFHSHSVIGIALVVGSASMSALYKVLFKLLLGSAKFGEAALFLSVLGVFNVLFITCIPVILYFTKVEYWSSFDAIPWGNLCGFSVLLLTFNIVLNFGIAVTYPTLMSLGIVLSVPVNAVVDHYTSKIVFNEVRVIAIIIIGLGFLLLLLPEEWDVWLIKLLTRLRVRRKEEAAEGGADLGLGPQSKSRRARPSFAR
ncbi:solute carrier family 35 member F3 isoform X3 [Vicugna pacos]|uniref:Solute carrier family 35 member F3 isoform X3 n=1 Tax=Vicugna pacos TaxID=30538 RepID=A0ABM5E1M5_VICPA